ncbi:MAG TPA: hypothetical protein ENN58_02650, partial [bacterium]|nr:hypothetical protein [bacterium]
MTKYYNKTFYSLTILFFLLIFSFLSAQEVEQEEKKENIPTEEVTPEPEEVAEKEIEETPEEEEKEKEFIKGEIANIGSREIISPYNSAGIAIGMTMIDERYYLSINPKLALRFDSIGMIMGFHLPLNIELFNTDVTEQSSAFTFRTEDYDEWQDFLKIIRYIQVGGTEDKFHFSIGSNFAQSIGHGTIVRRYIPNNDSTFSTLSTRLNWYSDFGGFEALFGDVGRGNMFGGLAFVKPFGFFDHYFPKSVSFGYVFFADRNAPANLEYVKYHDMPDPNLNGEDWDRVNETLYANERVRRIQHDSRNRPVITDTEFLHVQGLSFEFKSYKNDYVDIEHYFDYSWFKNDMSNGGFTKGILGRFNLDDKKKHAMRTQLEFRFHKDTYLPSFFDTFYDVERVEMMTNIFGRNNFTPDGRSKYWHLQNNGTGDIKFSFYGELSYSLKSWVALSFGYEQLPDSFSIFTHLELPDMWILKGMLSYSKRGITTFDKI